MIKGKRNLHAGGKEETPLDLPRMKIKNQFFTTRFTTAPSHVITFTVKIPEG
jgi:hypothetical protein